jgi:hypothetical protein
MDLRRLAARDHTGSVSRVHGVDRIPQTADHAITAATWGRLWTGRRVLVWTDNTSAESAINNRSTPDEHMQPIIRAIGLLASQHGFDVRADHINTKLNTIADPLSRSKTNPNWFTLFTQAAPNALSTPTTPSHVPGLSFRHV